MIGRCHRSRSSTVVTPRPVYLQVFGQALNRCRGVEASARSRRRSRRSVAACMVASKYSASPGAARRCVIGGADRLAGAGGFDLALRTSPAPPVGTRRRVLAAALAAPLHRHVDDAAVGAVTRARPRWRRSARRSSDRRRRRAASTLSPGSTRSVSDCGFDAVGHAVDERAQQLPPEVLVRHVLDGDRRVPSATATNPAA